MQRGEFFLQEIAPVLDDRELQERLEARGFIDDRPFSQWPILDRYEFDWGSYDLAIEPGQTFQYTMEFVMQKEISTVAVGSFFYNSKFSGRQQETRRLGSTNSV